MKKLIVIIVTFLSLSSCAQEKNCIDFKTGNFEYVNKNQPEKITRTENLQVETNSKTGILIHSSIKWTSECSYIMTYEKILNCPKDVSHMIGQKIYVDILETKGNKMKVHAKSDRIDTEIEFIKTN
ncbi:hypothetical protein [Flavobacterium sp. 120]|jgi:hypothetical protein|uniref:hypothetical protein n=1 Tax=Flavobacterium sp. 120 TaxID=2135626 RepID=UPI000EAC298F|nr:hypothetical protein [Flavobacterium sp. 120]RKS14758.1 hypothetical protein C8C87_2058 [Flavobacterium sp. 120]